MRGFFFIFNTMKKTGVTFLVIIIIGVIFGLFAQTTKNKEYQSWYKEALRLYDLDEPTQETDSLALQLFSRCAAASQKDNNNKLAADCFIKAGNIHQTYQRFAESNQLYHHSLSLNDRYLKDEKLKYEAFLYLGSSFYFSSVIDSAQHYFEDASVIALSYNGPALPEQERLYNSLGAIYFESANYLQAKNYFERALQITPAGADDYNETFVGISSNIANCLLRLNQYDSALQMYKMLKKYDTQKAVTEIITQNTAHTYFELGHYDSALALYKQLQPGNELNRIKALNDIGRIYMNRRQWQQAETVFDSAIALNKKISRIIKNKEEAQAYLYRGQLAEKQGLTDEAITWCNEALQEVHMNFRWENPQDIPADISQTISPIVLFEILRTKAWLLYKKYKAAGTQQLLPASLQAYRKAILTAKFIKKNFDNDEATIFFTRNYRPIYTEAIRIAQEAASGDEQYIDDYLFFTENYKGRVLYHNLQNIQLKTNALIPDSIKEKEKSIKQLLAFYTSRVNNIADEKDAGQLQKWLVELQVELSRLQKQYERDTAYNLYRYQTEENESSLSFIQSVIDEETALVNYFIDDSIIYVLAINKKNAELKKINTDSLFNKNLRFFFDELYQHREGRRYEGFETSARLYKSLIHPVEKITGNCSKWVVFPDGILYYLPFESLVKDPGKRDYILLSRALSYHYSFALLLKKNTHHYSNNGNEGVVAFAPYNASDEKIISSRLQALPYSEQEVNVLGKNIHKAAAATKQKFIQKASQHPLIHLATHASIGADSLANWIQFYPVDSSGINNKLFVHEIYNLDLHQAELVILSACETAGGARVFGEGLVSLSRAFMYAGSDGVISTLWKTEDRVTAYLMQRLHIYLQQKIPPEKALQLAKKDLLNSNEFGSQYKTPNYWSNFIYVGKITPVENNGKNYWWLAAVLSVAIVAVLFLKVKKGSG
jgi:CHAT domain-containing protein/tetratricopeptide (TPR) repeat protein